MAVKRLFAGAARRLESPHDGIPTRMTPLQAIGWRWTPPTLDPAWAGLLAAHPRARPARISEQHRSGYLVAESVDAAHRAESLPEWQRAGSYRKGETAPEARPAVGDWVLIEGEAPNALRIVALLPRFSAIKRGAAGEHYRQQVIAANIDTVFVVSGLDADFNPRRIERYLLLVGGSGVQPVVVLTKSDKDGADVEAAMRELRALEVPVRAVNAKDRASVAALEPWLKEKLGLVSQKSKLAEAIRYALSHWEGLTRFLDDGRVEIDSNVVERAIRPIALNRKNALFAGSDGGGEHWAVIASLVETCKLNAIDPQAYLGDVIARIVAGHPQSQIDDLLPWAYAPQPLKAVA